MLYIHGGGLTLGDNRIPIEGTVRNLVSRGVVVVSIQYRLGLFGKKYKWRQKLMFSGFFTTFTDDFPPNLGMLDQVKLVWRGVIVFLGRSYEVCSRRDFKFWWRPNSSYSIRTIGRIGLCFRTYLFTTFTRFVPKYTGHSENNCHWNAFV
jgi:hypothetical protein